MDIINRTHRDVKVIIGTSVEADRGQLTSRELLANDQAVVKLREGGDWSVLFRTQEMSFPVHVGSSKASVVLKEVENGGSSGYFVVTSVASIDALILYVPSIKGWAEKLDLVLRKGGLSTWIDFRDLESGVSAWEQFEKAVDETKNIVVLIGVEDDATERQRIARAVALGAVNEDPSKRMIPVLLGDAELPVFVRTAAHWTRPIPSIRVADPVRDWDGAVADLVEILKSEADPRAKGEVIDTAEEDRRLRRERMEYLKQVAAEMKIQEARTLAVRTE